jgi:hypothetical protein
MHLNEWPLYHEDLSVVVVVVVVVVQGAIVVHLWLSLSALDNVYLG